MQEYIYGARPEWDASAWVTMCMFTPPVNPCMSPFLRYCDINFFHSPRGRTPTAGCLWGDDTWASWRVHLTWTHLDTSRLSWSPYWLCRRKPARHTERHTLFHIYPPKHSSLHSSPSLVLAGMTLISLWKTVFTPFSMISLCLGL